jgi:ubiquinone/menaquinone biosynthesis C-methylase UbiE
MSNQYPEGIPPVERYLSSKSAVEFRELSAFNQEFLSVNKEAIKEYSAKWVANPFNQWSRQWEYPYVYSKIQNLNAAQVLDAGCGCTFFPFFLTTKGFSVHCCDFDSSLTETFKDINFKSAKRVDFQVQNLKTLNYPEQFFDAVYCISVLEHTDNYSKILSQFNRVLKPNGLLIVTFDVHLDFFGKRKANNLVKDLKNSFSPIGLGFQMNFNDTSLFTTKYVKDNLDRSLLPWASMENFKALTVCCSTWLNRKNPKGN